MIRDIRNYFYTKNCFKLIALDPKLQKKYKPKATRLGVLYLYYRIPKDTPEEYHMEMLVSYLTIMNESLVAMNLDGTINCSFRNLGKSDDENFIIYLVKFVPAFEKISWWYMIKLILILGALYKGGSYYIDHSSTDIKSTLINFIKDL